MRLRKAFWVVLATTLLWVTSAWAQGDAAKPAAAEDTAAAVKAPGTEATAKEAGQAEGDGAAAEAAEAVPSGDDAPPSAAASDPTVDAASVRVQMRDLEQRVDELKEKIRRSHTRLSLLSETVLSGGVGGAVARIEFRNDLTSVFRLTRALFVLDGAVQFNKEDTSGKLAGDQAIPVFSGSVPPGDHTMQVMLKLRGHGYGVFSYLRGYKFEVKSAHSFTVTEGKTIELRVVLWEKGGVTTPLEQRPAIRYVEKLRSGADATAAAGSAPQKTGGISGKFSVGTGGQ